MKDAWKRTLGLGIAAAFITLVVLAVRPSPATVEVALVQKGPLRVTIDEEGETRAKDRFVVATPVAGRLERIQLEHGDPVGRGQVVAIVHPLPLDVRGRAEAVARVESAQAAKREAGSRVQHAEADCDQARRERERAEKLAKEGLASIQALEQAKNAEIASIHECEALKFRSLAAAYDVEVAKAGLIAASTGADDGARIVELRSPVRGRVLQIFEKSERVIPSGTPVLSLGNPSRLEVVIDVLSTDAVKVTRGMPVLVENWGGEEPIRARVRLVEPAGFTKVSALGIEEKRVNVIADFVDTPGRLGDGYRVEGRIVIWEAANVLKIPSGALFRQGEHWAVFAVDDGRARKRTVRVGHRNAFEAEALGGVNEGGTVIVHPSNQITDGMRVKAQ